VKRTDFPKDFKWGIATSAAQIEGAALEDGKGLEIWDVFSRTPGKTYAGQTPDLACDYYHKYPEQLALMKELGFNSHRFSFSWARVLPDGTGRVNEKGMDFYKRAIDEMLKLGLMPNATLYHWDLPQELEYRGGFLNRDIADWFAEYAELMFRTFGDVVPVWSTFNEPIATYVGYGAGAFAPGRKGEQYGRQANHNLLLAHGQAVKCFRSLFGEKREFGLDHPNIGIVVDIWHHHPLRPDNPDDVRIAELENDKAYRSYLQPIFKGGYPDGLVKFMQDNNCAPEIKAGDMELIRQPLDFYGLNCYNRVVDSADPAQVRATVEFAGGNYMDNGAEFYPKAVYDALHIVKEQYGVDIPIFITENGTYNCEEEIVEGPDGTKAVHDVTRIKYLEGFLTWLKKAVDEGIDVRGYYVWSLLDNYEWTAGNSMRFGMVHCDFGGVNCVLKDSAKWMSGLLKA